jgi:hypothetical protein
VTLLLKTVLELLKNNKEAIDAINDIIVGLAALVGGVWVLLRLVQERTDEAALALGLSCSSSPYEQVYLVYFNVRMRNVGRSKIQAKAKQRNGYAYDDDEERLKYSASLQVRRIKQIAPSQGPLHIDWFEKDIGRLEKIPGLEEINLLSAYEDPRKANRIDFWMEPGESYGLAASIILPAGLYMAKITFVDARSDRDFWTRIVQIRVPVLVVSKS